MSTHLTHTFPIYINKDSKILFLGSFPSVKSREQMFYYGHPQNRFFKVLGSIFNESIENTVISKKAFLKKYHIALYDVIEECDIIGSSDASIRNVTPIDLKKILIEYPNIKSIGVNGKKASSLFNKYLEKDCRGVSIYHLPSTSPANAKTSLEELIKEYSKLFQK